MAIKTQELESVISQLVAILSESDNPSREGLQETPKRVAKSWAKLLEGYGRSFEAESKTFENTHGYNDIILSGKIHFTSTCEHHLLPFWGKAYVAYVPRDRLVGLSKLSRLVDIYSRRLQDQERITKQVADELNKSLDPLGVAVLLNGQHFCNIARGVEKTDSNMTTAVFTGAFEDEAMKKRFYEMIRFGND
jgi:GTP cyclohydrolase I